ncbi:hypothetical protein WR25_10573 [Diploscapter pachys]|uniref:Uncharacterized protein n=1 Tax=Diploscapter pachys TaxID=2018661 RepID=A0A2A2K0S1_9BILA|nr:hypothetical protein WR25_10573 [Diploscapter pachys]
MDRLRHLGLGQRQDVVIALLVVGQPQSAGIIGLRKLPVLDFGPERPVGDQDALGGFAQEGVAPSNSRASHAGTSVPHILLMRTTLAKLVTGMIPGTISAVIPAAATLSR